MTNIDEDRPPTLTHSHTHTLTKSNAIASIFVVLSNKSMSPENVLKNDWVFFVI